MKANSASRVALVAALLTGVTATTLTASPAAATNTPTTYELPAGFRPEGVAIGHEPVAYFGSLADGDILRVDLRSGRSKVIAQGPGTASVGLKLDQRGRLFVAGQSAGTARVVDTKSGKTLANLRLTTATDTFINDVVLTRSAAFFTDSRQKQLYRVNIPRTGVPTQKDVKTIPLTGDIVYGEGNNANGIARTPDGRGLIIVQSNAGKLFHVDAATGKTSTIAVTKGGKEYPVTNGDGLLTLGQTLFVVQNRDNKIAVLSLDGQRATVTGEITDSRFDVPTTLALYRGRLYTPNARFTTTPTRTTPYSAVSVPLP
ncbi:SMP-30/gluconolactonase/LRE family protein [Cryptosporangium sp. NPDC048952]|uniref:SMP-30/gluconolactonase/LRE family protein n=1 Tax=Cryptosporangium sp. NPDC048952 TaxID=3363961 RepID=UPI00371C5A74